MKGEEGEERKREREREREHIDDTPSDTARELAATETQSGREREHVSEGHRKRTVRNREREQKNARYLPC